MLTAQHMQLANRAIAVLNGQLQGDRLDRVGIEFSLDGPNLWVGLSYRDNGETWLTRESMPTSIDCTDLVMRCTGIVAELVQAIGWEKGNREIVGV